MATSVVSDTGVPTIAAGTLSAGEREELRALGALFERGDLARLGRGVSVGPIAHVAISDNTVLNEAYRYAKPSSFSRGIRFDLGDKTMLMISGTASIDTAGRTVHAGDFRAQLWRTYRNITALLGSERATWHDVVRTTCYLRDIERDYKDFNEVRSAFFGWLALDPLPASTGIQARLCREDLLVEIEALAITPRFVA